MSGLTSLQAKEALKKYGSNNLPQKGTSSAFKIFVSQLKNPFSIVLVVATAFSFLVGDRVDGLLIGAILVLNTILGFWQEYKASKELEALRSFDTFTSRVLRDGKEVEISSTQIVPGDVVILEAGDRIPSDGKILESYALSVNESILTGESLPVMKTTKSEENNLYWRSQELVHLGTNVISGRGSFTVEKTGLSTRFGMIAKTLTEVEDEKTPLEISLSKLIKGIVIAVLIISSLVFVLQTLQGFELKEVFLGSIALMVAAVPEGLPAVITIILALGVRKIYKKKALVRKMVAVESLGAATVILSDKTGTLTKNEMRVKEVRMVGQHLEGEAKMSPGLHLRGEMELLRCAVLCNSASLVLKENGGSFDILGDTTEGALLIWAKDMGVDYELMRLEGKLIEEIPFSLESRKMTVIWENHGEKITYTKGAPEVILREAKLTDKELEYWESEYQKLASKGLRILAFSKGEILLGLVGIADQIREEAKQAIKVAKEAGIKVVMVTGDNELTAKEIAEELGLLSEGDEVLAGVQLISLSDEELKDRFGKIKVFARIKPEDKYRLVKLYQSLGEVVAVTGDGVNDSLALKSAHVGVSMGKVGSDVAKESSDIVLLDDNFATLIVAIEQGRVIYSNILKVIKFLLTGNFSEILLIGVASFLFLPAPLLPTQILWINFVSDGLPALALGFDSPSSHIMKTPPRKDNNLLAVPMVWYVLTGGVIIASICLLSFYFIYISFGLQTARTFVFTAMVILQMCLPFIIRRHHSILSNKKLLSSVILMLILQLLILTVPQFKVLFGV